MLAITQLPPGKQRLDSLLKLCEDCSLSPPEKLTKVAHKVAQKGTQKARKKALAHINPAEYQLEPGFFLTQADEQVVQLQEIRQKGSGIALLSLDAALPWIREGQVISSDELAIVVPGCHQIQTTLHYETLNLPCKDSSMRPVILKATLYQLGEKRVKTHVSKQPDIDEQKCATIAVTYWRDDWKNEEWTYLVDHPFAFTRQLLNSQGLEGILQATWGKSLRMDKQPTTSQHATSVQFHATVPVDRLRSLLVISGFNKCWITPKDRHGRLDCTWRIIWLEGNWAHINSQASRTPSCAGLVKSKTSFGLRYATGDYDAAWRMLFPDKPIPQAYDASNLFRIDSLPHGCSAEMLNKWSEVVKWQFRPLKALGPNAWLVGSTSMPPSEFLTFNAKPVLVKYLPPKDVTHASPIVAGPLPTKNDRLKTACGVMEDPWAQAAQQRGLPPVLNRDLTGPTETRLKEQDTKLEEQSSRIEQMEQALEQLRADTKQGFDQVQQREQQAQMNMHTAIQGMKADLETSFQSALMQQSTQLNSTLGELRSLLQTSTKRGRGADEESMES